MRNRLGFTGHNFCAIADPYDSRPFCYTTDPNARWEYCDCQICNRTQSGSRCLPWDASSYAHNFCKLENDGSSYCFSSKLGVGKEKCHPRCLDISQQSEIQSSCSRTQNGRTCQRWDQNWPHNRNFQPIVNNHNWCSKPDGDDQYWCYTTDRNVRWEYCHPKCEIITTTSKTMTTTSATTIRTPKPNHISRTLHVSPTTRPGSQHIIPSEHSQCGTPNSKKIKKEMSSYSPKGYCRRWCPESSIPLASNSNNSGSARSMLSTGWMNRLQAEIKDEFDDKIYYANAKGSSFDFPWFVLVGTGCSSTLSYLTVL